jgi:hypothetical protein
MLSTLTRAFRPVRGQESGNPRAFGPGVMIYWHVERKSACEEDLRRILNVGRVADRSADRDPRPAQRRVANRPTNGRF